MKLLRIDGFVPDTARDQEHSSVVEMRSLIDGIASNKGTKVSFLDVSKGIVVIGLDDEKVLEHVAAEFKGMDDVATSEISLAAFQREKNKAAQERINKMRQRKKEKKG